MPKRPGLRCKGDAAECYNLRISRPFRFIGEEFMASEQFDYTALDFGETVDNRSGVIAICPACGRNGLKQSQGPAGDSTRYLHRSMRDGDDGTPDVCVVTRRRA